MDSTETYVHGYSDHEARRLADQADTLAALLHDGTAYPAGSRVLEAGCGVGAQTVHLVTGSPGAYIVAVDVSEDSLARARARVSAHAPAATVEFHRADLLDLPFPEAAFAAAHPGRIRPGHSPPAHGVRRPEQTRTGRRLHPRHLHSRDRIRT